MKRDRGFTLIEVIVVLVLVGLLAAMAGFGITTGVRGYLMAAENADITQKAQLAMTRLSREILECFDCDGNPETITLDYEYNNILGTRVLDHDGNTVTLNGSPLVEGASDLTLERESDGRISITLVMSHQQGGGDLTFETRIFPRNIFD